MMRIPKLLHMIWVGNPMPEHLSKNITRWTDMHPGWVVNVWGDEDLTWLQNQEYFDNAASHVPPDAVGQFKADIARYEILYNLGGFYADVDTYPLRNIEPALEGLTEFAAAEDQRFIGNTYLGAVPEHRVFANLIKYLPESIDRNFGARPCISTGPQYLTPSWRHYGCHVAPTEDWFPYSYKDVRNDTVPQFIDEGPFACHTWEHARTLKAKRGRR